MTQSSSIGSDAAWPPQRVILVLLDSLNRHLVGSYGSDEFATPNIDRFSERSLRFRRHYAGSLPCIPARHDLLCGALDFLWKPWGSIELWEEAITRPLRRAGVVTNLITDHPHLFEVGAENYHCDFTAWDYLRGHETDPWKTRADNTWLGTPHTFGRDEFPYGRSRPWFEAEEDFPGPRTMRAACSWIEHDAPHHERFLLFVDEFDPHEPFDTPEPYASRYDRDWRGPKLIWPPYVLDGVRSGVLTAAEARQLRAQYGAKLTMIDHWFGNLLDAIDRAALWSSTMVILCTDHGHYLGERDIWGKPAVPLFEPMGHLPLLISWPGLDGGEVDELTTTVDLNATLRDLFALDVDHVTHGQSLVSLLTGAGAFRRDAAVAGVWGREVQLIRRDGLKYSRAPAGDNRPLSIYSNRWSTMPVPGRPDHKLPPPDSRAWLDQMPGSTIPVIRQPYLSGEPAPYWAGTRFSGHHLYATDDDPDESENLIGSALEWEVAGQLGDALAELGAPDDQFVRLGLLDPC